MSDKISLIIGGREIADFSRYTVSSDIFEAADAFSFDLADSGLNIPRGSRCILKVNGHTELNGIIDRISRSYDKEGSKLTVEGRDLMGLLVDFYCTSYPDLQNVTLKDLASRLTRDIPFIKGVKIIYGKGNKARAVELTSKEEEFKYTQVKPGQTVFEVLKEKALSRGMLIYSLPDGTIVFGEPLTGGSASFFLTNTLDGRNNEMMSVSLVDDISREYGTVIVTGQVQGSDDMEPGEVNVQASRTSRTFPFYKPYVATVENDGQSPDAYARILMDGMQFDSLALDVRVPGHTQNGRVYQVNAIYRITDEKLGINSDLLCYGRTFDMSKDGSTTTLKLSKLGVLPA